MFAREGHQGRQREPERRSGHRRRAGRPSRCPIFFHLWDDLEIYIYIAEVCLRYTDIHIIKVILCMIFIGDIYIYIDISDTLCRQEEREVFPGWCR